jgi:hypothetical protein
MLLPAHLSRYVGSIRSLTQKWRSHAESRQNSDNQNSLACRMIDVFLRTWDLGFIAFGGPPVHFQILYRRFVEGKGGKQKWVDEQTVTPATNNSLGELFLTSLRSIRNSSLSARAFLVQAAQRCYSVSSCFMRDSFRLLWYF